MVGGVSYWVECYTQLLQCVVATVDEMLQLIVAGNRMLQHVDAVGWVL